MSSRRTRRRSAYRERPLRPHIRGRISASRVVSLEMDLAGQGSSGFRKPSHWWLLGVREAPDCSLAWKRHGTQAGAVYRAPTRTFTAGAEARRNRDRSERSHCERDGHAPQESHALNAHDGDCRSGTCRPGDRDHVRGSPQPGLEGRGDRGAAGAAGLRGSPQPGLEGRGDRGQREQPVYEDLRNPDSKAAAIEAQRGTPAETPAPPTIAQAPGFDWGDAGIGAGSALGLLLIALSVSFTVAHRRSRTATT